VIFVVAVLLLAVVAAASVSLGRWRKGRRSAYAPIPLVFPMNSGIVWETTLSAAPAEPVQKVEPQPVRSFAPPVEVAPPARSVGERSVNIPMTFDGDGQVPVSSETVRFVRPNDEVVQLLPGHLEVLSGDSRHQEIRFVRVQGQQPQLILGRNPGRSPQHVALNSSTVSRQHARLAFSGGKWAVANLSKTNPVVVNDQELTNHDGERQLSDGDRIELGEVVLRFHAH
jgi:pSer/pThr/pTyr-binding forkhead associated (FHA) protein